MRAREIMTASPACCTPESTAYEAARLMAECDCGEVPVVETTESMQLVGVVTDRDLVVRGLAQRKGADATVRDLMTPDPFCCRPDDNVKDVERTMAERQVRRIPVVDADNRCVGIIAQADLARAAREGHGVTEQEVARVVERISEPSLRRGGGVTAGPQPEARL